MADTIAAFPHSCLFAAFTKKTIAATDRHTPIKIKKFKKPELMESQGILCFLVLLAKLIIDQATENA